MMKRCMVALLCGVMMACMALQTGQACSTFCLSGNGQLVFGRNYDWNVEDGLVIVNKRNVVKMPDLQGVSFTWTSKYGSITFTQYGREFPHDGINEAGLVVAQMWLSETGYPAPDARPEVGCLQWIQYQLDNFSTVAEVIASDQQIRVSSDSAAPLHYLVCDSTGTCATIEFLKGEMVVHTGDTMPVKVLTNSTYASSMGTLKQHEGFGGTRAIGSSPGSLDRFVRAANMVQNYDPADSGDAMAYAFEILASIGQGEWTKWSNVYDITNRRVSFRTYSHPGIRSFTLEAFDFSCDTPVMALDVNAEGTGDVSDQFVEYTYELNRNLIKNAYNKTEFLQNIPDEVIDSIAAFPDSMMCQ